MDPSPRGYGAGGPGRARGPRARRCRRTRRGTLRNLCQGRGRAPAAEDRRAMSGESGTRTRLPSVSMTQTKEPAAPSAGATWMVKGCGGSPGNSAVSVMTSPRRLCRWSTTFPSTRSSAAPEGRPVRTVTECPSRSRWNRWLRGMRGFRVDRTRHPARAVLWAGRGRTSDAAVFSGCTAATSRPRAGRGFTERRVPSVGRRIHDHRVRLGQGVECCRRFGRLQLYRGVCDSCDLSQENEACGILDVSFFIHFSSSCSCGCGASRSIGRP